jgi:hypothetical protein
MKIQYSKLVLFLGVLLCYIAASGQGGASINSTGANPDGSAMLDVAAANKGVLIPRLQLTDINDAVTVNAPANSLLVFNLAPAGVAPNDVIEGFYYWDASLSQWVRLVSGSIVGTDDQQIDSLILTGNILTAYVEDGGSATVDLTALINDADFDPTNEHNTGANLTGTNLNIIDGGGTLPIDMNPLLDTAKSREEWIDGDTISVTGLIYARQALANGDTVVISDGGRVGVGTTTPMSEIHTVGGINDGANVFINDGLEVGVGGENIVIGADVAYFKSDASFGIEVNSSAGTADPTGYDFFINEFTKNVGIGTVTPGKRLDVSFTQNTMPTDNAAINGLIITNESVSPNTAAGVQFQSLYPGLSSAGIFGESVNSNDNMDLKFWTEALGSPAGRSTKMTLNYLGNLGIGTITPTSKLSVDGITGNGGEAHLKLNETRAGYTGFANHKAIAFGFNDDLPVVIGAQYQSTSGVLDNLEYFYINVDSTQVLPNSSNPASTPDFVITPTGNVGIGTITPSKKLEIKGIDGGVSDGMGLAIENTQPLGNRYNILSVGDGSVHGQGNLAFVGGLSTSAKIVITPNGNIGIGTTAPTQLLTVANGTSVGTYTTAGWVHTSDARLKTNVTPITSSLDKVMQIQGVNFDWKEAPEEQRQIGFLAQDLQKILPEAVVVDSEGAYGVAYGNLTPLLVEAVKELKAENDELKSLLLKEQDSNIKKQTESASADEELIILLKAQQAQIDELKLILQQTAEK